MAREPRDCGTESQYGERLQSARAGTGHGQSLGSGATRRVTVDPGAAYAGPASAFGKPDDPLVGRRLGGVDVFGGGLALYNVRKELVGAIGVSGDTSCADHNIVWRTRQRLGFDWVPAGVSLSNDDNINYQGLVPALFGKSGRKPGGFFGFAVVPEANRSWPHSSHGQLRVTLQKLLDQFRALAGPPPFCGMPDPVAQRATIRGRRSRNGPWNADKLRLQRL
jgi:Haem-degrading